MNKEDKKYPKVIAGAFVFNKKNELLMLKSPFWENKFCCVGGKVETGEKIEETVRREVMEETNLKAEKIEFITITDGLSLGKNKREYKHLIFIDYKVFVENPEEIKLNEESDSFEWRSLDEWLDTDEKEFAPYNYEVIKKLDRIIQNEDCENKYKRAIADYQNLLKQTAKEKEEFGQYAKERFLHEILPVYDNLKVSLEHIGDDEKKIGSWVEGIRYIIKQFSGILSGMGLEAIKTKNSEFDPKTMDAVKTEETDENEKDGIIAKELAPGYRLGGRVIKPSRVIVYKYKK